ncbi:MAG TPA: response regulator [Candidatus Krumholzibacteria bacterium]|jgi:CheY-like chemotaxis protein
MAPTSHERIPLQEILQGLSQDLRSELPAEIRLRRQIEAQGLIAKGPASALRAECKALVGNFVGELLPAGGSLELSLISVQVDDDAFARRRGIKLGLHVRLGVRAAPADPDSQHRVFVGASAEDLGDPLLSRIASALARHDARLTIHSIAGGLQLAHVYFPVINPSAAIKDELRRGCGTVLFVDDDDALVDIHRRSIESMGYEVIECTEATRALELVGRYPDDFDVVISDLGMPDMSGDELARRIRSVSPDLPVGLSTGLAVASGDMSAPGGEFEILLAKPFSLGELGDALDTLRESRRGKGRKSDESAG